MSTSISGTGSISSPGIGSGIDVNSLVSQLIAAQRAPLDTQINGQITTIDGKISAYQSIQSALTNLQAAEKALQGPSSAFNSYSASSSDSTVFTATASSTATAGSYDIQINALATASKLASKGFGTTASAIGTGTLTISVGGNPFSVVVDSTNNSPTNLANAINSASGNTGVTASLITADDGTHLILSANKTGSANTIAITQTGGDGGLSALVYDPTSNAVQAMTPLALPGDASVSVDKFTYTSASNQVSDSITGINLNLVSAEPGTTLNLTVAANTSGIDTAMQNFVSAYNAFASVISSSTSYNAATQTASALTGDSLSSSAQSQVLNAIMATTPGVTGGIRSLFDLGITTNDDGSLTLDSTKLNSALATDPASVANLFSTTGAVGSALQSTLDGFIGDNGVIISRTASLNTQLGGLGDQETALNTRMNGLEALYTSQYTALDTLMSQMNSTSSFLTSIFNPTKTSS
jgi:flagellar hook-associated protein 2